MNAAFVAFGRIKMVTPTIFFEFCSAYELFSKIEIYYLIVKIQNVFSGNCQDTIFCFFEYWSENPIGCGRPSFDSVFFFFFDRQRGVRYKSRETTRVHRVRYYCVCICSQKKSHLRVIVNYGWFTGVNVQGVLPSDFVFQSVAGL